MRHVVLSVLAVAILATSAGACCHKRRHKAHGGHGCISVTSNVAPRLCSEFHVAWQKGDAKTALALHDKLMPLHTNLFMETSPAPIKYAMSLLGKMDQTLRLPMVPVSEPTRAAVRSAMVHAGLIN